MPNFVDCWGALKSKGYKHADGSEVLNDQDRASIETRIQEHLRTGLDPIEAAKASVRSHLDEAHAQLQSIYDQVKPTAETPTPLGEATPQGQAITPEVESQIRSSRGIMPDSTIQRLGSGNYMVERGNDFAFFDPKGNKIPLVNVSKTDFAEMDRVANAKESPAVKPKVEVELPTGRFTKSTGQWRRRLASGNAGALVKNKELISQLEEASKTQPVSEAGQAPAVAGQPKIEGGTGEEVQKGQEGRQAVLATERVQPPAVPPESPEALGEALKERPRSAGVANRVLQERAARGEIPQAPEAGQGFLTEDLISKGRQEYSPERAAIAAENVKKGAIQEGDPGVIRVHEEALTKAAADAERALDADPKNPVLQAAYKTAETNMKNWQHETVQPWKTRWSNEGKTMMGETNIDTGTYTGLQKLAWDTAKRDFTPQEEPVMRAAAKRSDKATKDVRAAIAKAEDHVQKVLKPSRYMDLNQLRESLAEKLKNITC